MQRFSLHLIKPARTLRVSRFVGREAASRCYRFTAFVEMASQREHVDPLALFGKQVVLDLGGEEKRSVGGVVQAVRDDAPGVLRVRIGPRFEALRHRKQNRIFQVLSVPQIVDQVLDDAGRLPRQWRIKGVHPARSYTVQYRETDLAFVERLLAEEGIFYYFDHDKADKDGEALVMGDDASAYAPIGERATLRYAVRDDDGGLAGDEVRAFGVERLPGAAAVSLSAYDPERPLLALSATATAKKADGDATEPPEWIVREHGETADVRAGRAASAPQIDDGRAGALLEQHRRHAWRAKGESVCAALRPCATFALDGRDEIGASAPAGARTYVCAVVEHEGREVGLDGTSTGGAGVTYRNRFACATATVALRPAPARRRPIQVSETAIVVGPAGQEIHTDSYGRVKVQFFWDRDGKRDEKSSCWLRVVQPWAGSGMGVQFIPRVGMEVLVTFLNGDPDRPVVSGCLSNLLTPPPFDPNTQATRSGIHTRSVPAALPGEEERYQELSFDDTRGAECISLRAQRDFLTAVGGHHQIDAGGQTVHVRGCQVEAVDHDAELHVGGLRVEHFDGGVDRQVGGDVREVVTGKAALSAGGGSTQIQGDKDEDVAGEVTTRIGGCNTTIVGSPKAPASWTVQASGSASIGADGAIEIASPTGIVLRSGDTELRIGPTGVDIVGPALRFADPTGAYSFSVGPKGVRVETPAEFRVQAKTAVLFGVNACLQIDRQVSVQGEEILLNSPEQERNKAPEKPVARTMITLVDDGGKPVAGARFVVHVGDERRSGVVDKKGTAVVQLDAGAKATIEWPRLTVKTSAGQAPASKSLGAKAHVIKDGEHLAGLAHTWGLDADAIWADPRNADLRAKRKDFHILAAGDVIRYDAVEAGTLPLTVGSENAFRATVKRTPVTLKLAGSDGKAFANEAYEAEGPGLDLVTGTTGADGSFTISPPSTAKLVNVRLTRLGKAMQLGLGGIDPADSASGAQQRLAALGAYKGPATGKLDAPTVEALTAWQGAQGIKADGRLDADTVKALQEAYGC